MHPDVATNETYAAGCGTAIGSGNGYGYAARAGRMMDVARGYVAAATDAVRRGYNYQRYRSEQARVLRALDDMTLRDIGVADRSRISAVADAMARAAVRRDEERRARTVSA